MAKIRQDRAVRLEFGADCLVQTNLSGAAFTGEWLWVAGDEACGLDRLERLAPVGDETLRFGAARDFPLADLLDLPGGPDEEADLEGMAVDGGFMWVVGSHGLKRKAPKPDRSAAENAKRLTKLSLDGNRCLLACLPIDTEASDGPNLVRRAADGRRALCLKGNAQGNELTALLLKDPHFGPFMSLPGKGTGFDIAGLAVQGGRVLVGLRGPVLRGWSALLEFAVAPKGDWLRMVPLDDKGTMLRKHFLQLEGLGVRDLHFVGDDLYLLAGPTMVLNGEIRVFRWSQARQALDANTEPVRFESGLVESVALPHGHNTDRAEALCGLPAGLGGKEPAWLVLYDAPGPKRRPEAGVVMGDLLAQKR